jgi:hypothetical protein
MQQSLVSVLNAVKPGQKTKSSLVLNHFHLLPSLESICGHSSSCGDVAAEATRRTMI